MTVPTVTYDDYTRQGGTLGEDAFKASSRAAVAWVRDVIGFNVPQDAGDEEAYVRAVCAAVEVDAAYGCSGGIGEGLASVSIGSFSASLGAGDAAGGYDADMTRAIRRELSGSGLLYQGIR